jgi:hypothetical protein
MRGRGIWLAIGGAFAIALLGAWLVRDWRNHPAGETLVAKPISLPPISGASLTRRFALLERRHSSQCGLRSQALRTLPQTGRLQGSCCRRMDYHRYVKQIEGLKAYAGMADIPRDPYDVSVLLARRLISYRNIGLTPAQEGVYRRAVQMSHEHGPCCCRCWRWYAFRGQARQLIARHNWGARQVASLWDLEDGCGGKEA